MPKTRNQAVPAVYLILKKDNQILLMRRQGSGYYDGWYSVPAGHVESGELPIDALLRETKEELGIELDRDDVHLVHTAMSGYQVGPIDEASGRPNDFALFFFGITFFVKFVAGGEIDFGGENAGPGIFFDSFEKRR